MGYYYIPFIAICIILDRLKGEKISKYSCKYNTIKKAADISLADFSGVRDVAPEFFTKEGCSEIYIHTAKGNELFNAVKEYLEYIPLKASDLEGYTLILKRERVRPKLRDEIYNGINDMDDRTYVELRLKKSVSKKGIVRFYIPYEIRKALFQRKKSGNMNGM